MKTRSVLLSAVLMVLAVTPAPALAQPTTEAPGSRGAIAVPSGESPPPDPPDYVLREDGTVVIDGDSGMDCRSFALSVPRADASPDLQQAQSVLERCERRGLLLSGAEAAYATEEQQTAITLARGPAREDTLLPATGGPGILSPATVGEALLVGLSLLGIGKRRRDRGASRRAARSSGSSRRR